MRSIWGFVLSFAVASSAFAGVQEMQLEDMEGLLPSSWLDRTGFRVEGEAPLALSGLTSTPLVPLMPVYQSGGFRNTYVGGVIDSKYLVGLDRNKRDGLIRHIRTLRTKDGNGLIPYNYDGKIYAIRDDYQVSYMNSTTVGLSVSFGGPKTVILGKTKTLGVSIDFGAPIRIGKNQGFNAGASFQNLVDEWSANFRPDDTQMIVDQAVTVTPYLISYLTDPAARLTDEAGRPLPLLNAQTNSEMKASELDRELLLPREHSSEWGKVQKDLRKNVAKEVKWRQDIAAQVAQEKIISNVEENALIQNLCDRLATIYRVPPELWPKCRIAATMVPNAWAYPGGDIFITVGMLGILSEIDSAALVLGHEIGHVMGRHTSKRIPAQKTVSYAASYISTAASLGLTAFSLGGGFGLLGDVTLLSWFPQAMASSTGGSYILGKSLELAFFAPAAGLMMQSRAHESQADRLGQEAAFSSGMDIEKMNQGWAEFIGFFDTHFPHEAGLKERIMMDHPAGDTRLRAFRRKVDTMNALHGETNQKNLIDQDLRQQYARMHSLFKPYSDSYGRYLRQQYDAQTVAREKKNKNPKLRHFMHTMMGAQTQCVRHALGAE